MSHRGAGGVRLSSEHRGCDGGRDHPEADTRHRIRMLNQLASNNTSVDRDARDVDTVKGGSSVILSSHRVTIEAGTTQGVSLYTVYRVCHCILYTGCWSQCPGQ